MRQTFMLAACALATAGLAAQSQPTQSTSRVDAAPKPDAVVTVTGCLASGANNTFTLTAAAQEGRNNGEPITGTTATTPTGSKVAKTIEYALVPSNDVDLKSEVGHMVKITGREAPVQVSTSAKDTRSGTAANAPSATGTSGSKGTPTVQTTEQTQIVARQLTVSAVKKLANKCDLVK